MPSTDRLGAMLLQHGLITSAQLQAAQALGKDMAQALVDLGFLDEAALSEFFVKRVKTPRLSLQDYQIDSDTVQLVPAVLCLRYRLLPIDRLGKSLTLAMVNPLNDEALAAVRQACPNVSVKTFLCTRSDFEAAAARHLHAHDAEAAPSGGMSLEGLGLQPNAAPPTPDSPPTPDVTESDDDAHATMLFDNAGAPPRGAAGPLRSSLICLDGWELGREVEITGESLTLGRSPEADMTIKSPLISRVHARLTRNAEYGQETVVITDLESSNGTFVNNIPVTSTILRHGDRILIGNVLFKFVLLDEVEARFHKDVHHLYSIHKDTGLLTRDDWSKELDRAVAHAGEKPVTAALIALDGIGAIREQHGPIAGVIVLSDLCDALARHLERTDLPGNYGNERVAVLFEDKAIETVFPLLEDLRRTIEAHVFHHKDAHFKCSVSIGLASTSTSNANAAELLTTLEAALASAADNGGNQSCVAQ